MATIQQRLSGNPIAWAERTHQQRTAPEHQRRRRMPIVFALGLIVSLLSYAALQFSPQIADLLAMPTFEVLDLLRGWFGALLVMLGALIMIHHLSFASSGLQLAAAAIAREKQARTWESLLLTGVDARRIIVGKWWATMQTLWADFRLLVPLRFGVALWIGVAQRIVHLNPFFVAPTIPVIILISVVVAVFPLVYAAFSAVVGLLAALITNSETSAARLGSLLHFGTIALSFAALLLVISLPFAFELGRGADPAVAALLPGVFVTPLDGGMLSLVGMITGGAGEGVSGVYLVGLALCTLLYALLTGAALWAATRLAVRLRVTPP